jgi:hypothetical protein
MSKGRDFPKQDPFITASTLKTNMVFPEVIASDNLFIEERNGGTENPIVDSFSG